MFKFVKTTSSPEKMVEKIDKIWSKNPASGRIVFEKFGIHYSFIDQSRPVVITFDNMTAAAPNLHEREGWGLSFLNKNRFNCLSFLTSQRNWYRGEEFQSILNAFLRSKIDLSVFPERIGYGSSMGAYAAAAYGDVLSCEKLLLFHPISTLNQSLVPWETRKFTKIQYDWEGPYHDSADGCKNAENIVLFVDNIYDLDFKHAKRYLANGNVRLLRTPGLGHGLPTHFAKMGVLKEIVLSCLEDTLESARYGQLMRFRRNLPRYYHWLLSEQNQHLTPKRKQIISQFQLHTIDPIPKNSAELFLALANYFDNSDPKLAYHLSQVAAKMRPRQDRFTKASLEFAKRVGETQNS
ncbi:MAG: hypothetical protein RLZZ505_1831 [Verrucomicrobiota bacterium]|jgi:hypothetical protein